MIRFILLNLLLISSLSAVDFDGLEGTGNIHNHTSHSDGRYVLVREFKNDEGMQPHPSHQLIDIISGLDFGGSTVDTRTSKIIDGPYQDKCIAQKDQLYWTAIICGSLTDKSLEEANEILAKYGVSDEPFMIEYTYTANGGQVPTARIPNFNPKSKADRAKLSEKITSYINQNPGSDFEKILRKPGVLLDGDIKLFISDIDNSINFADPLDKNLVWWSNVLNLDSWVPGVPKRAPMIRRK